MDAVREYLDAEVETLRDYLDAEIEILRTMNKTPHHGYLSIGHFVREHGRAWNPAKIRPCPKGEIKACFRNAALLALDDPKWIYVEGMALGVIPVLHAWCVTKEGEIGETTWPEPGTAYFGIPFTTAYLNSRLRKYQTYGLIDQYQRKFPILRESPKLWRHPHFTPE
jgi:hypothetical protein